MKNGKLKVKSSPKGITLIALVITIIVLLILAGVTISLTLGDNGIFKTAEQAGKNYTNAQNKELAELNEFNDNLESITSETKLNEFNIDKGVNKPKTYGTGLTPVTINADGTLNIVSNSDNTWYDYVDTSVTGKANSSHWANAKTADGSMWVWIPRYAYKITYTDANDKSLGGTIDVVFLKGATNLDANGKDVTSSSYVDSKGNVGAYIVHPAFKDGSKNGYANGEWDSETTGFWMAKFEAGYAGTVGDTTSAQDSKVKLSVIMQWNGSTHEDFASNYYGARKIGDAIKYPVFQANKPSMNNLGISDAFDLSRNLTASGNPYGLKNIDSHMMKNSEWGAVAYLTHSQYGRNKEEVTVNNVSVENENTVYAVTGYAGATVNAEIEKTTLANINAGNQAGSWTTQQGQTASSTGNVYGIYDLSGGAWEWTAGYVATTGNYETYGGSLKGESNKYKSKYAGTSTADTKNYNANPNPERIGEAIWELSTDGTGSKSWNSDYSSFWMTSSPFSLRGNRWIRCH